MINLKFFQKVIKYKFFQKGQILSLHRVIPSIPYNAETRTDHAYSCTTYEHELMLTQGENKLDIPTVIRKKTKNKKLTHQFSSRKITIYESCAPQSCKRH